MKQAAVNYNINPNNRVHIDKTVFIWLDILGFANALENEDKYNELSQLLEKFKAIFNESDFYSLNAISDGIILEVKTEFLYKLSEVFKDIGEKTI